LCTDAEEFLNCACNDTSHVVRLSLWKDASGPDFLITVHLTRKPLLQRLRHAFLHVVGRDLPYGHFQKALLQAGDVPRLRRMLDEFESASREAASPR